MKEEHQDKLAELLIGYTEKAGETTSTIVEWLQTQAPELCSEIITYHLAYSGVICGVAGLFLSVCIIFSAWIFWTFDDNEKPCCVIPLLVAIIPTCVFFCFFSTFLKCYFAPKLFLLEYMKGFM